RHTRWPRDWSSDVCSSDLKTEGFDFCDTTHCQDFRVTALSTRLRKAVEATSNEVLRYDGRPIPAYYHQDCGGITEPRAPYLGQQIGRASCREREEIAGGAG